MENNNNNNNNNPLQQPLPHAYSQKIRDALANQIESADVDVKSHPLPVTRVKRIMKFDPDVQMISKESPHLLAKACELFILDLTMRSSFIAQENNKRILQRSHISTAVARTATPFDFLLDVFNTDEPVSAADVVSGDETVAVSDVISKDDPIAAAVPGFSAMPQPDSVGILMGTPVVDNSEMYVPQPLTQAWPEASTAAWGDGEDTAKESGGSGGLY